MEPGHSLSRGTGGTRTLLPDKHAQTPSVSFRSVLADKLQTMHLQLRSLVRKGVLVLLLANNQ